MCVVLELCRLIVWYIIDIYKTSGITTFYAEEIATPLFLDEEILFRLMSRARLIIVMIFILNNGSNFLKKKKGHSQKIFAKLAKMFARYTRY